MTTNPAVSVVIVNWNSGALLLKCLYTLERQSLLPSSIVIVDNASKDGSLEGIWQLRSPIKIIRLNRNIGFAAGNNLAAKIVKDSDWIALINPDAFADENWLKRLIQATKSFPDFSCFGSQLVSAEKTDIVDGEGDEFHVSGLVWRRSHGYPRSKNSPDCVEIFSPCAAAALYRRDIFLDAGGFDERYFCYSEDVDLGFRMRLLGHRCLYVPDAVVEHVGSATTGGQHGDFAVYHGHRNLVWTYFKNMPWPLFWLYLPQHILLNLITLIWFTLRGQGRIVFKAKWDALKGLPRVLRERRKVQATRRIGSWELRKVMAKGLLTPYLRRRM